MKRRDFIYKLFAGAAAIPLARKLAGVLSRSNVSSFDGARWSQIEAIGRQREMCGLAIAYVPSIMLEQASAESLESMKRTIEKIHADLRSGDSFIVVPALPDECCVKFYRVNKQIIFEDGHTLNS